MTIGDPKWFFKRKNLLPVAYFGCDSHNTAKCMTQTPEFSLELVAGKAFGSGGHPSTQAALLALQALHNSRKFNNILDMGCGSGILALVAATLWDARVLAADINRQSQEAVVENAAANGLSRKVSFVQSDGFKHPLISQTGSYDLILCNMVAERIIMFSRAMDGVCGDNGVLVLSGILHWLAPQVEAVYAVLGYATVQTHAVGDWRALVLEKTVLTKRTSA